MKIAHVLTTNWWGKFIQIFSALIKHLLNLLPRDKYHLIRFHFPFAITHKAPVSIKHSVSSYSLFLFPCERDDVKIKRQQQEDETWNMNETTKSVLRGYIWKFCVYCVSRFFPKKKSFTTLRKMIFCSYILWHKTRCREESTGCPHYYKKASNRKP